MRYAKSGVPQCSLLVPYLFGLCVSSLRPVYPSTFLVKYMDNICMIAGVLKNKSQEDIAKAQSEIDNIPSWANSHNLKLNIPKTNGLRK